MFHLVGLSDLLLCLGSLPESILETASHRLHVTHTSSTDCATTLSFFTPVELSHLLARISARRAGGLLDVEGNLSTSAASCVRLVVSLTK